MSKSQSGDGLLTVSSLSQPDCIMLHERACLHLCFLIRMGQKCGSCYTLLTPFPKGVPLRNRELLDQVSQASVIDPCKYKAICSTYSVIFVCRKFSLLICFVAFQDGTLNHLML